MDNPALQAAAIKEQMAKFPMPYKMSGSPKQYLVLQPMAGDRQGSSEPSLWVGDISKLRVENPPSSFWFGTRRISPTAQYVDYQRRHVLRLSIPPSLIATFAQGVVQILPQKLRSWVEEKLPEWFLPPTVILKKQQPEFEQITLDALWRNEVNAYERLKSVQGTVVPKCYGQVMCQGLRCLLLEEIGGVSLAALETAEIHVDELENLLINCYIELGKCCVVQDDTNVSNFRLVDGKVVVLDFDTASYLVDDEDVALIIAMELVELLDRIHEGRRYHCIEGRLQALEEVGVE